MNVCVIGAGASGLTAAIIAARNNNNVFILERNNKSGKKILLTGNGRCNYWNENQSLDYYHSKDKAILKTIYDKQKDKVLDFFTSIGIIPKIKNGYYYPYSNQASSILSALLTEAHKLKIKIYYEQYVTDIYKKDDFTIVCDNNTYKADKVILATGSKAYPKTGSDGNGYNIAQNLGHNLIPVLPSLCSLIGQDTYYKDWEGVRSEVVITLRQNSKIIKKEKGEIQFTKQGISGICVFNLSGQIAKGLKQGFKEEVLINFVPWCQDFTLWMKEQTKKLKNYTLKEIMNGFLNYKLVNLIFKLAQLPENCYWDDINQNKVTDLLTDFKFVVKETNSFDNAQVCSGGVPLGELSPTLESQKVKGLFFSGEILDVDGDCGGYNLGFAWMSGILAGESVNKND